MISLAFASAKRLQLILNYNAHNTVAMYRGNKMGHSQVSLSPRSELTVSNRVF